MIDSLLILLSYFDHHLLLIDCKKKKEEEKRERKKDSPWRTKNIPCVVISSTSWVADQPLDLMSHYEDVVKFSWVGCDRVDIFPNKHSQYQLNSLLLFHLRVHSLCDMELNDPI